MILDKFGTKCFQAILVGDCPNVALLTHTLGSLTGRLSSDHPCHRRPTKIAIAKMIDPIPGLDQQHQNNNDH